MIWALMLTRWLVGAVFLYAGAVKSMATEQFFFALTPFTVIPSTWLGPIAHGLPWVEIVTGALLLVGRPRGWGAALALILSLAFCAMLGWALSQGIIVSCACFGQDETPSVAKMAWALARDFVLALLSTALLGGEVVLRRKRRARQA